MNLNFKSPEIEAEYEKTLAMLEQLQEFIDSPHRPITARQSDYRVLATFPLDYQKKRVARRRRGVKVEKFEIVEFPPVRRTISIAGKFYSLQFPYHVFAIDNFILYFFFAKEPITSFDTKIWYACLPNVFPENFNVCVTPKNYSMKGFVEAFWNTHFRSTNYTGVECTEAVKANFGRFKAWEKMDLEEVIKRLQYIPYGDKSRAPRLYRNIYKPPKTFGEFMKRRSQADGWKIAEDVAR